MTFDSVYCFSVRYGYTLDTWQEKTEHGFVVANNFEGALEQLRGYYGDDMLSFSLEYIGDTGLLAIDNKQLVEDFRKQFIGYHYGDEDVIEEGAE